MAEIDSRIAMGVQPLDVGASIGRGYQLRDLAAQADTRAIDNQLKQQAVKKQATLGDFYKAHTKGGTLDRAGFFQSMTDAGYGGDIPELQKQFGDGDKSQEEFRAKRLENGIKANDYTTKAIAGLLMKLGRTPADVHAAINNLVQAGVLPPEQGQMYSTQVPTTNPQALDTWLQGMFNQALSVKEQLQLQTPKIEAVNLGGTTQMIDTNAWTNPSVTGKTLQRTATPGEVEQQRHNGVSEANTVRGQNLTDARARDFNQVKVEENKLKREAKEEAANQAKAGQLASFDTMLGSLDRLSKHPGLSRSVGVTGMFPTMPGSDSANFQAELETFKSQSFIPMVSQLKGMGALSDAEGKKLTAAVGALDPKMGETAFRQSVDRIMADMKAARGRMTGAPKPQSSTGQAGDMAGLEAELRRRGLLK